jgi:Reverse transcriptase (RNA-dependent DNA polymerase)
MSNTSLFIFRSNTTVIYLLVYVDDIIIIGNDSTLIDRLLTTLSSNFLIKDLGDLHYFLGIEVSTHQQELYLTQSRYLISLLQNMNMLGATPCTTLMQAGQQLSKHAGTPLSDPYLYRSTVGALQYATLTRPDLAYAVNKAAQFVSQPINVH